MKDLVTLQNSLDLTEISHLTRMNLKNKFHIPVFHHQSSLLHVPPTHSVAGVIPYIIKIINQCSC